MLERVRAEACGVAGAAGGEGLERLRDAFLRSLDSPSTVTAYRTEIGGFLRFLEGELGKDLCEATAEDLSLYRGYVMETYARASAAKKLTVARRFLIYAHMSGAATINPEAVRFFGKSPKVHQDDSYEVLSGEEMARLLETAAGAGRRDHALVCLLAGGGLRVAEAAALKVGDLKEAGEGRIFLRVYGKGSKVRNVSLSPELGELVRRYVESSGRSTSRSEARKPLFPSREGRDKHMTSRAIRYIVVKHARAAGISKTISPHSLRHTAGTNMAHNKAPLLTIQQFLGHSDPKTTLRYIRRAEEIDGEAYRYNVLPMEAEPED